MSPEERGTERGLDRKLNGVVVQEGSEVYKLHSESPALPLNRDRERKSQNSVILTFTTIGRERSTIGPKRYDSISDRQVRSESRRDRQIRNAAAAEL
ncbi:hypothetical protein J6590_084835 [Homalodisca vitripennis]|nr:hypothetical protein J6590_084835 [Homalodisca vitripennis]